MANSCARPPCSSIPQWASHMRCAGFLGCIFRHVASHACAWHNGAHSYAWHNDTHTMTLTPVRGTMTREEGILGGPGNLQAHGLLMPVTYAGKHAPALITFWPEMHLPQAHASPYGAWLARSGMPRPSSCDYCWRTHPACASPQHAALVCSRVRKGGHPGAPALGPWTRELPWILDARAAHAACLT